MAKRKIPTKSRRTINMELRNEKLYNRYYLLTQKKTSTGKPYLSFDAILDILHEEFFLEREYISRIISNYK